MDSQDVVAGLSVRLWRMGHFNAAPVTLALAMLQERYMAQSEQDRIKIQERFTKIPKGRT